MAKKVTQSLLNEIIDILVKHGGSDGNTKAMEKAILQKAGPTLAKRIMPKMGGLMSVADGKIRGTENLLDMLVNKNASDASAVQGTRQAQLQRTGVDPTLGTKGGNRLQTGSRAQTPATLDQLTRMNQQANVPASTAEFAKQQQAINNQASAVANRDTNRVAMMRNQLRQSPKNIPAPRGTLQNPPALLDQSFRQAQLNRAGVPTAPSGQAPLRSSGGHRQIHLPFANPADRQALIDKVTKEAVGQAKMDKVGVPHTPRQQLFGTRSFVDVPSDEWLANERSFDKAGVPQHPNMQKAMDKVSSQRPGIQSASNPASASNIIKKMKSAKKATGSSLSTAMNVIDDAAEKVIDSGKKAPKGGLFSTMFSAKNNKSVGNLAKKLPIAGRLLRSRAAGPVVSSIFAAKDLIDGEDPVNVAGGLIGGMAGFAGGAKLGALISSPLLPIPYLGPAAVGLSTLAGGIAGGYGGTELTQNLLDSLFDKNKPPTEPPIDPKEAELLALARQLAEQEMEDEEKGIQKRRQSGGSGSLGLPSWGKMDADRLKYDTDLSRKLRSYGR